jgi:hypothetical protein
MITIDYNAGEITFTPLFTITSEMRIAIEYQYLTETTRDLLLMQVQHIRMQNGALVVTSILKMISKPALTAKPN